MISRFAAAIDFDSPLVINNWKDLIEFCAYI